MAVGKIRSFTRQVGILHPPAITRYEVHNTLVSPQLAGVRACARMGGC